MEAAAVLELTRSAAMLLLVVAGPLLIAGLVTGVVIGLFQALTQVQEATLTFVPKLLIMGIVLFMALPTMGQAMSEFMVTVRDTIVAG